MESSKPTGGLVRAPAVAGPPGGSDHLLTVVLEDYFQVAPLKSVVQTGQWYRFESRVESNTRKTLDLLDEYGVKATFFVLGWIADAMPEVVRKVAERGHEIASKGYDHRSIAQFTPGEFREDVVRSREALQRACGRRVHGFRIAHGWFGPEDLWALDVLAEEGFAYDSSLRPIYRRFAREPRRRSAHVHTHGSRRIHEFPLPAWTLGGWSLPIAGGNYLRQFPHALMRRAIASWCRRNDAPFLMYFHVWELDPDQPRIRAAPFLERVRQYRNLHKMSGIIRYYLERYRFTAIGDHLGLTRPAESSEISSPAAESPVSHAPASVSETTSKARLPVSIVIPCFNEELILPYLANTLRSVEATLARDYDARFIFVDDGSSDGTWSSLQAIFGGHPNCVVLRHERNRGVAAAILTGIRRAESDVVCSIDCDCTYDPHQLQYMIPMLKDDVDLVTASPYHPDGLVRNVPSWRLFLSKGLSSLYRVILGSRLHTYTSCFRVYRRSAVEGIRVREHGFLGVAEMLGVLALRGGRLVECPAVLDVRLLGRSKMKVLRTIAGHVRLLLRLGFERAFRRDRDSLSNPIVKTLSGDPSDIRATDRQGDSTRRTL